jgi:hypothetical protein
MRFGDGFKLNKLSITNALLLDGLADRIKGGLDCHLVLVLSLVRLWVAGKFFAGLRGGEGWASRTDVAFLHSPPKRLRGVPIRGRSFQ